MVLVEVEANIDAEIGGAAEAVKLEELRNSSLCKGNTPDFDVPFVPDASFAAH